MTDKNDHDHDAEPGMPTAGRRPLPVENEADEVTQLLGADSEGPTVETPRKALLDPTTVDLDGPTRRLSLPAPSPEPVTPAEAIPPTATPADDARVNPPPTTAPADDMPTAATTRDMHESAPMDAAAGDDLRGDAPPRAERPEVVPEKAPPPKAGILRLLGKRPSSPAGLLILALLALFGFTLVVQLRSNDGDDGLASARQEDLVRILSDLEARDSRLQSEISALETSQRQLTSGVAGRQAALAEAEKRADELGLLAGTVAGRGPGLRIVIDGVKASAILNTVQELRGAGGEVMQIAGAGGKAVRIVASSYFVDAEGGGIIVDGDQLPGPYVLTVIGVPQVMQTALQIPGGVVASVNSGGGSVTLEQRTLVEVTAVRDATTLQYARPAS
ncbi:DUF881 domain-containing protein [Paractinoplanes hotanensis]|uniref:DUF881 domain-containing protein n=1 Tax=Paractinoplanes hotanensis TaxID=2906497 RepID=A0ABT0Y2B2_9ACTN|nr:DUF881 domain-containing protein [Actinoplanes hotanensis]MCM4080169.1 DUF881 domain-containing protein [Actinoplanes hotanensis]